MSPPVLPVLVRLPRLPALTASVLPASVLLAAWVLARGPWAGAGGLAVRSGSIA
jgi:hypothetical protein